MNLTQSETRFSRSSKLLLLFGLVFILLDIAQLAYRFSLPTEGWEINPDSNDFGDYNFYVIENVVGAASPLQPGDGLHIIGGIPAEEIINIKSILNMPTPTGWQVGAEIPVTVIRDGQSLNFEIPLVNWTFEAMLRINFADLSRLEGWLAALIVFGAGLLTFIKRPGNLAARFLFLFGLAVFAIQISGSLPDGLSVNFYPAAIFGRVLFLNVIFAYMFGPSLLGFGLTFPHPKAFIQKRPWLLVVPFVLGSSAPILLFIQPDLAVIGFQLTFGMVLGTIAALLHSGLTMRDAISRAQLRWAVGGVVFGLALFSLNFLPFQAIGVFENIGFAIAQMSLPIIGLSLAVAILRYRLFDIDVIIRRTLQYSLLTILLGLVYFGSVTLMQVVLTTSGGESSPIIIVLTTLFIAALFNPMRRRLQDFIDRRFYRQKYDAEKALAEFATAARSETDLEQLSDHLSVTVRDSLQPEHMSLWLKPAARQGSKPR